jgi:hypothetical protein
LRIVNSSGSGVFDEALSADGFPELVALLCLFFDDDFGAALALRTHGPSELSPSPALLGRALWKKKKKKKKTFNTKR